MTALQLTSTKRPTRLLRAVAAMALLFSIATRYAPADSTLRCDNVLVSIGASNLEVLEKCGAPHQRESWETSRNQYVRQFYDYETERFILPKLIVGPIQMERWTYNFGSNKFIRYLMFQNGTLIRIETGEKGSDD